MQFLFKSVFSSGKTAVLNPPPDVSPELNLAPPQSADGAGTAAATAPATEPAGPPPNEEAVLQDFLLKNFLLDDQAAQTAVPYAPPAPRAYAHIPDSLPELSSNADAVPETIAEASPQAHAETSPHASSHVNADA